MITEPKVTLWASTIVASELLHTLRPQHDDLIGGLESADYLAEAAGRACYASFARPNPKTALTADYIRHILEIGHESVLAHASATFYIEGVSRSLTHELVRSRFLAFSQISQRYVNSSKMDWVCPPLALDDAEYIIDHTAMFNTFLICYEADVKHFMEQHHERFPNTIELRKRAREAARGVLPNYTEAKIVVSGNMRAWRDFLKLRLGDGADLEIQRLAHVLLHELHALAPATFSDFEDSS